ncbi:MAG: DUF916 and DUF3324 domain-containing protein [Culicoidibacterales bacterium]
MKHSIKKIIKIMMVIGVGVLVNSGVEIKGEPYNEFSVSPLIPDNQKDVSKSYFDILLNPQQEQTLDLVINNAGSEVMKANIELFDATTGDNGVLVYTQQKEKDSSLATPITSLAKVTTPILEIGAKSSATAKIKIMMPPATIDGELLGGVSVTAQTLTNKEATKDGLGLSIGNEIAYVVGLKISQTAKPITTKLNYLGTEAKLKDYKTSLGAKIQNDQPIIMKGAKITGTIYEKNGTTVVSTVTLDNVDIAPNSNFDVVYSLKNREVRQGEYRIWMKAEHLDKTWEWNEVFSIGDEARQVNSNAFEVERNLPIWQIISMLILSSLILYLIIWFFFVLKNRKKNNEVK